MASRCECQQSLFCMLLILWKLASFGGFSHYAPVLAKLFILDQYDDAELDRKKVAAMFAGFVRRPVNDDMDRQETDAEGLLPLEPGQLQFLEDGEDITFAAPSDVGGNYEAFQYRTLLQVAAGLGLPYANITADMVKANYSNTRAALPEYETHRADWLDCDWLPPRWDWVDPLKDIRAEVESMKAGLKSRSQAISERGYDASVVDLEIAADRQREQTLGIFSEQKLPQ